MRGRPEQPARLIFPILVILLCIPFAAYPVDRHALMIGIADYEGSGYPSLDGPINDVDLVRQLLKERFGFRDEEIRVLKNAEATHTGIRKAFADLAKRVKKNDVVYIHFSGHGSLTPDLSGEKKPLYIGGTAYDSTWVSFGSRLKGGVARGMHDGTADIDGYDILDDEVGEWLIPIYDTTDNVTFVSDSCHSGNMTRGDAPKVRAIPVDLRPHPLGKRKFAHPERTGVIIGSAREDQQSGEFRSPTDRKSYGVFTWHWVQALSQTLPGDTWEDAFKRTIALIDTIRETQQHPQIEGNINRSVFGGAFPPHVEAVAVSAVSGDGRIITLKAGKFAGVTAGSVYMKKGSEDTCTVTEVQPFSSYGKVIRGSFREGDLAVEDTHVYPYTPLRVFVRSDVPLDNALADALREAVAAVPGYETTNSQKESDFMLLVIRPKREQGELVKAREEDTLPLIDPAGKPEIWFLAPDERPTRERLLLRPASEKRVIELVTENLKKISRIRELKRLGVSDNSGAPLVELFVSHYSPDPKCRGDKPVCIDVHDKGTYRLLASVPFLQMQGSIIMKGDILTFRIRNNSSGDLYCYLFDISPDGRISAIFPGANDNNNSVLVPAGREKDFADLSGLLIEEPGEDTVKLIASRMPMDVTLFEQTSFSIRGEKKGRKNTLEEYLRRAMGAAARGPFTTGTEESQWGTVMFSFVGK